MPRVFRIGDIWTYGMMTRGGWTLLHPTWTEGPAGTIQVATRVTQKVLQNPLGTVTRVTQALALGWRPSKAQIPRRRKTA